MRHLLLIRHSAVAQDPQIPSHQWPLSANGRSRAHALTATIAPYDPPVFITSEEQKAVETGQIIADALGKPCHTAPNLHEHDRRGVPYYPQQADFETAVAHFFTHPTQLVLGRETAVAAQERFTTAVKNILTQYPNGNIAIVTHGTVITLFVTHFNAHISPIPFWQNLTLPCHIALTLPTFSLIIDK